jgi:hypothetical protein
MTRYTRRAQREAERAKRQREILERADEGGLFEDLVAEKTTTLWGGPRRAFIDGALDRQRSLEINDRMLARAEELLGETLLPAALWHNFGMSRRDNLRYVEEARGRREQIAKTTAAARKRFEENL